MNIPDIIARTRAAPFPPDWQIALCDAYEALEKEHVRALDFCIGLTGHHPDTIKAVFAERDRLKVLVEEQRKQIEAQGSESYIEVQKTCARLIDERDTLKAEVALLTNERDNALAKLDGM